MDNPYLHAIREYARPISVNEGRYEHRHELEVRIFFSGIEATGLIIDQQEYADILEQQLETDTNSVLLQKHNEVVVNKFFRPIYDTLRTRIISNMAEDHQYLYLTRVVIFYANGNTKPIEQLRIRMDRIDGLSIRWSHAGQP